VTRSGEQTVGHEKASVRDACDGNPLEKRAGTMCYVRMERTRENVFTVTATSQELTALVAAARMALEAMRAAPDPPPRDAVKLLERVLEDFDRARDRLGATPRPGG